MASLSKVVSVGATEKVTLERSLEREEEVNHVTVTWKGLSGMGSSTQSEAQPDAHLWVRETTTDLLWRR